MSQLNAQLIKIHQYNPPLEHQSIDGSVAGYSAVEMKIKQWYYSDGHIFNKSGLVMKFPHMKTPNNLMIFDGMLTGNLVLSIILIIFGLASAPYGLFLFAFQFINLIIIIRIIKFPGILIDEFNQYVKHPLKFLMLAMNIFTVISGIFIISLSDWDDYFYMQQMLAGVFSVSIGPMGIFFTHC